MKRLPRPSALLGQGRLLVVAALVVSSSAWGQPAPPPIEPAPAPAEPAPAPAEPAPTPDPAAPSTGTDSSLEGYVPPGAAAAEGDAAEAPGADDSVDDPVSAADDPPPAPLLGPPTASEQGPAPVPAAEPRQPSRRALLAFYAGAIHRHTDSDRVTYGTSFAYGPALGTELFSWLRVLAYARFEEIPVSERVGAFDTAEYQYPDTIIDQPNLNSIALGFRIAPTWVVTPWFRAMAFFDIAWNRFTAPEPRTYGATQIRSAERAGVGLNTKGGLGISVEPIPNWLDITATGAYGVFSAQTGSAFRDDEHDVLQGFDQTGNIVHLAPLPRFDDSLEFLLMVGIIL